jgi:hypothetical protein
MQWNKDLILMFYCRAVDRAKVTLPESCMMKANDKDIQVSPETTRVPAPERRNLLTDEQGAEMMDSVSASRQCWQEDVACCS